MDELLREMNEINAVANLRADYAKTLALLRALKGGRVFLEQVALAADGWQINAIQPADNAGESPEATEEPA